MSNRFDDLRAGLRRINGTAVSFDGRSAPNVLPVIADLVCGKDVSEARLRSLQQPSRQAFGSSKPSFLPLAGSGGKTTAVVAMHGIALYDLDWPPYCFSTRLLARTISVLAADPSVDRIVLDVNTPGGSVTGTPEAADAVWSARKAKPIIGIVNPLCASAGYWIASQCSKIIGVPSADVGSIGVFVLHLDQSKMLSDFGIKPTFISAGPHKTEGNPLEPLSAEAKAFLQREVDKTYVDFTSAVARGRGTTLDSVKSRMGGGRCLDARDALHAGMIDVIAAGPDAAMQSAVSGSVSAKKAISPGADYRARIAALTAQSQSPAEQARKAVADGYRRRIALLKA